MNEIKKAIKIIVLIVIVGALGYAGFFFLASKGIVPVNVVPNARTLYNGEVSIEPVVLSNIEAQLKAKNIHHIVGEDGIEIYPHGPGFGPLSFTLTQNSIKASKDIPGTPDKEKYKEEVRQDIRNIGDIITIRENTWEVIKTTYPWMVIY